MPKTMYHQDDGHYWLGDEGLSQLARQLACGSLFLCGYPSTHTNEYSHIPIFLIDNLKSILLTISKE